MRRFGCTIRQIIQMIHSNKSGCLSYLDVLPITETLLTNKFEHASKSMIQRNKFQSDKYV